MRTRFSRINKKVFNKAGTTIHFDEKTNIEFYSTRTKPQINKTLGFHADEFPKQLINPFEDNTAALVEQEIAKLTPLQKKCLALLRSGAMSFGSISLEAHMTIAAAMNLMAMYLHNASSIEELNMLPGNTGPYSNSGEGGEFAFRNNTIWQSRIRQIASGRFGVDIDYVANAKEVQIKINQGAKPGKGGKLPGNKVTDLIAKVRNTKPGTDLLSPPPHHDIYSIEDLKQLDFNIKSANPMADTSVKLVARRKIGAIVNGTVKTGAKNISIAGHGGTGAATLTDKYELTHPWEYALAESHQSLVAEGLRDRVTLTVSGGLQTGLDLFVAILLGADYLEIGTGMLVSLGCVMAEVCHNGKCPTGIATTNQQNIDENFKGTILDVVRYTIETAKALSVYLARYGFTDPKQAVGRVDLLAIKKTCSTDKSH